MSKNELIVQKYGGATLADPEKIKQVALRIFNLHKSGSKIVVIVSAMGETTNQLIKLAQQISSRPALRELDMLLTTGERISMSLLSMALNDLGCPAISYTGSQAGIITDESHICANIIEVKAFRVEEALRENKVVILAGFQGVSQISKEITTLGRGGSDITAVAMAGYLKADRCEILKDVDCVYSADPKLIKNARPLHHLNYRHLLEMTSWGAKVLHYRSVKLAAEKNVELYIGAAESKKSTGTTITHLVNFPQQTLLAINSFSNVYALNFTENQDLNAYLQKNQIGELQYLFSKNQDHFFTAPSEILNSLSGFEKNQHYFKIKNAELSSVSATFSEPTELKDLQTYEALLLKCNIEITASYYSENSLHFFIGSQQKNEVIRCLHDSIK